MRNEPAENSSFVLQHLFKALRAHRPRSARLAEVEEPDKWEEIYVASFSTFRAAHPERSPSVWDVGAVSSLPALHVASPFFANNKYKKKK
jgi:hypothetical protein